ncbi:MAG: TolB protein [Mariprofundaceae bacterium]|nr:TolB protein [Mariprofundaceae bacterium]
MKKTLILIAITMSISTAQANNLFDFMKNSATQTSNEIVDGAQLVTLEPKESEMYPKASPDGRYLLTLTSNNRHYWISRRAIENGDPLNAVSDDLAALASVAWFGQDVTFLSSRTGMLGLWKKPADGEGLMRRSKELTGKLKDITLLKDGSIIATRLVMHSHDRHAKKEKLDNFNNWKIMGTHGYIVHIAADGSEKRLSEGFHAAVSPDGQRIVFSMPIGRSIHLFLMDIDGSNLAELTDVRSVDVQATWSPDGQWIVFSSNRSHADMRSGKKSQWDVWAVSSEGKKLTQLTFDAARDGAPSLASNGYVYFHSDRKVGKELKTERQIQGQVGRFHIWRIKMPQ